MLKYGPAIQLKETTTHMPIKRKVHQGNNFSPKLFTLALDPALNINDEYHGLKMILNDINRRYKKNN